MNEAFTTLEILSLGAIGIAALIIIQWRPWYGLFLYGVSLGFPDLAVPLGDVVRLRMDDAIVVLLAASLLIQGVSRTLTPLQRNIVQVGLAYLVYSLLSAVSVAMVGLPPDLYRVALLSGGVVLFGVIVNAANTGRSLKALCLGMTIGGLILASQVFLRIHEVGGPAMFTKPAAFKSAIGFETWNPGSVALAGLLFTFVAGIGLSLENDESGWTKAFWLTSTVVFVTLPIITFSRGAAIGLLVGGLICLGILRRWWVAAIFAVFLVILAFGMLWYEPWLVQQAVSVDVATGEGFSRRYDFWAGAWSMFEDRPFWGHGFGRETSMFSDLFGRGESHNVFLTVLVELGLIGLLLFGRILIAYGRGLFNTIVRKDGRAIGAALGGLFMALCIESLASSGLYWSKMAVLGLAIICVGIGLIEKEGRGAGGY